MAPRRVCRILRHRPGGPPRFRVRILAVVGVIRVPGGGTQRLQQHCALQQYRVLQRRQPEGGAPMIMKGLSQAPKTGVKAFAIMKTRVRTAAAGSGPGWRSGSAPAP